MSVPVVVWDAQTPAGVSLMDHYKSISIYLSKLMQEAGGKGVYVVSPEIAAIIDSHFGFTPNELLEAGEWPAKIGTLCGRIEIWVDAVAVYNQACLYDEIGGHEIGRLQAVNLLDRDWNVLDYLARI